MNCHCNPPSAAAIKTVQKPGSTFGREFFTCARGSCNFFHWADVTAPPPMSRGGRQKNVKKLSKSNWTRIIVESFESEPQIVVWLSLTSSDSTQLMSDINQLPADQCKYKPGRKMWVFDFTIYEDIIKIVKSKLGNDNIEGLPRFLELGIKSFLKNTKNIPAVNEDDFNLIPSFKEILLPHQIEGLKFVISRAGRALIGDEMG